MPDLKFEVDSRRQLFNRERAVGGRNREIWIRASDVVGLHPGMDAAAYGDGKRLLLLGDERRRGAAGNRLIEAVLSRDVRVVADVVRVLDVERLADFDAGLFFSS